MRNKLANNNKIGLALSGGAVLGVFHIGVLKSFRDHGIVINCLSGTSAGAIVAALHAFGISIERMEEFFRKLSWLKLYKISRSKMGLSKTEKIGKLMEDLLGRVNIEEARIPLAIVASDIKSGKKAVFKRGSLSLAIMASCCVPGLFVPVRIKGSQLVDGGIVENLPLATLDQFKPDLKIGVNLMRWRTYREPKNTIEILTNALEIMISQQKIVSSGRADVLIEPRLEKYNAYSFKKAVGLLREGYSVATETVPEIKQKIASLS